MIQENGESQADTFAGVSYFVDIQRAEAEDRALDGVLAARRCSACQNRLGKGSSQPSAANQIKQIGECCAKKEDFIKPGMPLQEIVFRVLLKGGNQPMALQDIHYAVSEEWARPAHPMAIAIDALRRTLDQDRFYGFVALVEEVETEASA